MPFGKLASLMLALAVSAGAPAAVAKIEQIGGEPSRLSSAEFTRYCREEIDRWKDVVVKANIKIQ